MEELHQQPPPLIGWRAGAAARERDVWKECVDEEGSVFLFNVETGETRHAVELEPELEAESEPESQAEPEPEAALEPEPEPEPEPVLVRETRARARRPTRGA